MVGVGESVEVRQGIVEGVPLSRLFEPDLEVVVRPARLVESPSHSVAEAGISHHKSLWQKDLATHFDMRITWCARTLSTVLPARITAETETWGLDTSRIPHRRRRHVMTRDAVGITSKLADEGCSSRPAG